MKNLIVVAIFLALAACGGGGSDSGGGVANGEPGPTPYAGLYQGQMNLTVGDATGGTSGTVNIEILIRDDGQVLMRAAPGTNVPTSACSTLPPPTFINGNQYDFSLQSTCFVSNVGNCTFSVPGSATVNARSIVGSAAGKAECTSGQTFNVRTEIGANKV